MFLQLSLRLRAMKRQVEEAEEEIDRLESSKKKLQRELEEQLDANEQLQGQLNTLKKDLRWARPESPSWAQGLCSRCPALCAVAAEASVPSGSSCPSSLLGFLVPRGKLRLRREPRGPFPGPLPSPAWLWGGGN